MVCKKGPNKAHKFEKHVCVHCGEDDLDFVREVLGLFTNEKRLLIPKADGMVPADNENYGAVTNCVMLDEDLMKVADELDDLIVTRYCDGCDRVQDCDDCDERKSDTPRYEE